MKNNTRTLRAATQATVIALAFATASIGAPAAFADEPEPETNVSVPEASTGAYSSGIDANHKVSLTINKRLNANTTNDPNGKEDPKVNGTALGGVTFSIQKINKDITTKEGFQAAAALTPDALTSPDEKQELLVGPVHTKTTSDGSGSVTFSTDEDAITPGAYLVKETSAPQGVVKGNDFIVFLPMTDPEGTGWNYDVVAYPKNTKMTVTKEISGGEDANAGDVLEYTLKTNRPPFDKERSYLTFFNFEDSLPDELRLKNEKDNKVIVKIGDQTLTEGDDYVVTKSNDREGGNEDVAINFTNGGLVKLRDADDNAIVSAVLPVEVQKIEAGRDGKAANVGKANYELKKKTSGNASEDPAGKVPTETPEKPTGTTSGESPAVESRWANIKINKTGEGSSENLSGAEFKIYRCTDKDHYVSEALTVGGEDSWTTDAGVATIKSVIVPGEGDDFNYCLEEVKAPKGYELLVEPVVVDVRTIGQDATAVDVNITNLKSTSSKLPSTGGAGVGLLMALGASILGLGAFAAKRASRKSQ
ncbi:SpaH/EbpB family LPXTG-anchored major pilin [Corynebacterium sp. CCM 8835]|uniref:SpaH/EbpB family LPXTG-anchored major pilin n=1 Tax=Corynebacterium antarcticum TaxID=2800405 RepID=A0ABS1FL43_9CORY|nr:SpaH/EbpB family LPXTG-anchored major pilin [Corynebacterium antarcticum]MCK7660787.1 SpaH/EbpB family LPXTG-anchored major pilin [Corynebacterium antarcticum]MCL0245534.1 SpaH/EbpB family LPXTG-anchored major pilin [Corynebacterium antarcticum]MCX7540106.1 SpaH/EbpB family LPXTG-anchored major pilin [Corynebacterium antarcticum]